MTDTEEVTGALPRLTSASKTDVGRQREQNEDACFEKVVADDSHCSGLFIVADGMGGYRAGEIASQIAVETITAHLLPLLGVPFLGPTNPQLTIPSPKRVKTRRDKSNRRAKTKAPPASPALREAPTTQTLADTPPLDYYTAQLKAAIEASSMAIVQYGNQHKDAHGLGSTVTAALAIDDQVFIANVGDSRTYLLREHTLHRVTQDHSLVERLVQSGQIEPEDIYEHPNRNLIYRSLGANRAEVEVDIFVERLLVGDTLLLCSDGLWEMVRDAELAQVLATTLDPQQICDQLIELANEHGGEDNITAVVVRRGTA